MKQIGAHLSQFGSPFESLVGQFEPQFGSNKPFEHQGGSNKPFEPQGASSEPKFDQFELQVEPIGPYDALSPNFVNLSSILAHWRSKLAK